MKCPAYTEFIDVGKKYFNWMKSNTRSCLHFLIRVMNPVESPKEGDLMDQPVLPIDCEI